jgi:hypothetical protein
MRNWLESCDSLYLLHNLIFQSQLMYKISHVQSLFHTRSLTDPWATNHKWEHSVAAAFGGQSNPSHLVGLKVRPIYPSRELSILVAGWLTHSPATLDVTGSCPSSGDFTEIYFLESIQSPAMGDFKWSV